MKAILTKYHGATNTKGSRVSASDGDRNKVTLSWDYELNTDEMHRVTALALCEKMGWSTNIIGGGLKNGYAFVFVS